MKILEPDRRADDLGEDAVNDTEEDGCDSDEDDNDEC